MLAADCARWRWWGAGSVLRSGCAWSV
jgi:hypothetical protein